MTPNHESLSDTILDIAGYAVIAYLIENKLWDSRLKTDTSSVEKFLSDVQTTFFKKLQDYGLRDIEEVGIRGAASRLTDKLARLKNLIQSEKHELLVHSEFAHNLHAPKKNGDVGYDLATLHDIVIPPNTQLPIDVSTGVKVKVPEGSWGMIINRSSTPRKKGLMVMPGVIDTGYTGELFACVWNMTGEPVEVKSGERLAQLILIPSMVRPLEPVAELPSTERGDTGFGSTN